MAANGRPSSSCDDRDIWLITYFINSAIGKQFEIVHKSTLVENSWRTLTRGAHVLVERKHRQVEAIVLNVSGE